MAEQSCTKDKSQTHRERFRSWKTRRLGIRSPIVPSDWSRIGTQADMIDTSWALQTPGPIRQGEFWRCSASSRRVLFHMYATLRSSVPPLVR